MQGLAPVNARTVMTTHDGSWRTHAREMQHG
eukprot:COSAG06_NODE_27461_length_592_cov_8.817656_2_plen_30_part_01